MKIKVKKRASTQFRKGYPLIQKEDLVDTQVETTEWIDLVDQQNQFVAKGYLGKQNKGIGWVLSRDNEVFDTTFLRKNLW